MISILDVNYSIEKETGYILYIEIQLVNQRIRVYLLL
jgi:hypothetical protein